MHLEQLIDISAGRTPAELVLRNGRIVNVLTGEIEDRGDIAVSAGRIAGIGSYDGREIVDLEGRYVCPGFIDAHVHIESSMLSVPEFTRLVCTHGTTAVVTDPHEIANVMGTEGIRYMLTSSKYCPVHVYVMLSSCVPASPLEGAGAELQAEDLLALLNDEWVLGLAEMMNYPGVVHGDRAIIDKLTMCADRIVDGHCPGLTGRELQAYIAAGIASDHESTTADEAREKLRNGMFIMIREGSQARNLEALLPVVTAASADRFMFVTDDKDVEDILTEGHINHIIRRAIALGMAPVTAIRLATINPARYFGLRSLGAVAPGYAASLAIVDDLERCHVSHTYKDGRLVARDGQCIDDSTARRKLPVLRSTINVHRLEPDQFAIRCDHHDKQPVHVLEVYEGQLVTGRRVEHLAVRDGEVLADPGRDIAKLVVIDRHQASGRMGFGFIHGLALMRGAIAGSVGHDAHNIVVAGTNDQDIYEAAVHVARMRGGLCAVLDGEVLADMPLPIAGLMSAGTADEAGGQLQALHRATAEHLGCKFGKPFMALSFMSLSVIGALKVTDQGLIDVDQFKVVELFAEA